MSVEIIAELSCNHMQDRRLASALIVAAKAAGADTVKFQTYQPDRMAQPGTTVPSGPWAGMDLRELYRQAWTPWDWHAGLREEALALRLQWLSSPCSPEDVAFLETLDCPRYKIGSFERSHRPLREAVLATGKPVIVSLGLSGVPGDGGWPRRATFLACTSAYPAPLRGAVHTVGDGLSDHSRNPLVPALAVARGAQVIEAHLMLAGTQPLDAAHSLDERAFAQMVSMVRQAEEAMAPPEGDPEAASHIFQRKATPEGWFRG